jgi:hypothetical protein
MPAALYHTAFLPAAWGGIGRMNIQDKQLPRKRASAIFLRLKNLALEYAAWQKNLL